MVENGSTLAVHLRLTDKTHSESPENNTISNETIVKKVKFAMNEMNCTKVLLCTDSKKKKAEIYGILSAQNIECVTYNATLADNEDVGLHFNDNVPASTHLKDIVVEVVLMADGKVLQGATLHTFEREFHGCIDGE